MFRYAVVTGSNKGIGFETVRQLASKGITVVLTARDEKKGLEAVEKLKASGVDPELLLFHQLDISDLASVSSLADFIKTQFGKLDILVRFYQFYSFPFQPIPIAPPLTSPNLRGGRG